MPHVLAVCVVHDLRSDPGIIGVTGIDKRPVADAVKVGPYGLRADIQADRKNHGGLDKAVYAYSQQDADYWAQELDRELPAGWFGENLRTDGIDLSEVLIGERWRIGSRLELEVTQPRTPCQTFARWVGGEHERGWVRRFSDARRLGAYFRVLRPGPVQAGDEIVVLERPEGAPTVLDVYRGP